MRRMLCLFTASLTAATFLQLTLPATASPLPAAVSGLQWRLAGPFRAGRSLTVAGIPGDGRTFYFGAVGGGVWKTENAGRTWTPIFDAVPIASVGALALAPSDPNVVYVGTGEADMRSDIQQGNGVYRSRDAGKTWQHVGLDDTRQIGRIVVDPRNANIAYVAALGHQYGPNGERGVFKTTDGGTTWRKILFKDENTGAIDLAMDPKDPQTLFASLWQTRRPPWNVYPPSNGPGGGVYVSHDAGASWKQIVGNGFPARVGHVGLAISGADSHRIYAQVDTNDAATGGVYRSDDAGATWQRMDGEARIWHRGWYFGQIVADPKDRDTVYVMNTSTYRSTDGGRHFTPIKGSPGGDDYHAMWIDPQDTQRIALASDQGTIVSLDGARTWSSWFNQPTAQIYHIAVDRRFPYWLYGAQQDSGAIAVPSRTAHTGISERDWRPIDAGGESGTIAADPFHPGWLYGSAVTHEDLDTTFEQNIDPTLTRPGVVWRSTWTLPMVTSPADPHALYYTRQRIFESRDGGQTWRTVSPDLSRSSAPTPVNLDATTARDTIGLARRGVVYSLAPSPIRRATLWAGTDDGLVWITRDAGATWRNCTPGALTPWSKVGTIDASHFDPNTAYISVDRHRLDDNHPYVYRTHDGGAHWTSIASGIPNGEYVNVVREDPYRRGLLYAGTEFGIYVSFDDGASWRSLRFNLPVAAVRDIAFGGNDVAIATHGRSFWILDDVTPLRQFESRVQTEPTHLFRPADAIRMIRAQGTGGGTNDEGTPIPPDEAQGANPPYGAYFDYALRSSQAVEILVRDASGRLVRRWSSTDTPKPQNLDQLDIPAYWVQPEATPSGAAGGHRFVWDLSYGEDSANAMAPPGTYRVTLRAGGMEQTQSFRVLRDPRLHATDADLKREFALLQQMNDDVLRAQRGLQRARALLKTHPGNALLTRLIGTEPATTPDDLSKPAQDFGSLRYTADALATLMLAVGTADAAPTRDQERGYALLHAQVERQEKALASVR